MADVTIDISAFEAELANMSEEDLRKSLLDIKVKQKIATKKYYNPEAAKAQRQKAAERMRALVAKAKELGIYDSINEEAGKLADEKLIEDEATAAA